MFTVKTPAEISAKLDRVERNLVTANKAGTPELAARLSRQAANNLMAEAKEALAERTFAVDVGMLLAVLDGVLAYSADLPPGQLGEAKERVRSWLQTNGIPTNEPRQPPHPPPEATP